MAARLTPDQKVGRLNRSGLIFWLIVGQPQAIACLGALWALVSGCPPLASYVAEGPCHHRSHFGSRYLTRADAATQAFFAFFL